MSRRAERMPPEITNPTTRIRVHAAHAAGPSAGSPGAWVRRYASVLAVLDLLALVASGLVAEMARFGSVGNLAGRSSLLPYLTLSLLMAPVWGAVMALGGAYELRHLGGGAEEYRRVLAAGWRFLAVVATVAFVFKYDVARGFVAFAIPLATAVTLAQRYLARRWLHRQRGRGRFLQPALLVGSAESCRLLATQVRALPYAGFTVVGACVPAGERGAGRTGGARGPGQPPVLGHPGEILEVLRAVSAEAVLVADHTTLSQDELRQLAWRTEGTGVSLMVTPEVFDVAGPRLSVRPVAGLPLVHVDEPELSGARRVLKEGIDRTLAGILLVVTLPLVAALAVAVRLTSPGPALFGQVRVGQGGRPFTMYKLRSMTVDAEEQRAALAHLDEADGLLFKVRDDPRVTRLGRHLRRWSLDELPQLWNVVRGDMSIVGPRPPLPSEADSYSDRIRRRLLVKPGLTGLWQVSGRSQLPWEEAVRLDLYYVEHWSPSLDATILLRTGLAILRGRGAY
jgi:exopolysaccharide biosynthesis polyprenyl glycosylphosphotransferase